MKLKHLLKLLRELDPETEVLKFAAEDGYEEVCFVDQTKVVNRRSKDKQAGFGDLKYSEARYARKGVVFY